MSYPLLIGLTGGIGSGKTVCAKIFKAIGIPVYSSDDEAKSLMVNNPEVVEAIKAEFGNASYDSQGQLNRGHLSSQIFQDECKLKKMNAIVHPAVRKDFIAWVGKNMTSPYVIQESALLLEIGAKGLFDKLVLVDAPEEIRIQRVMNRDQASVEEIKARMSKQLPSSEKRMAADLIIENDESAGLIKQIIEIHLKVIQLAQTKK